ncbi:MAG: energy transducer TonB [Bacteroidota bacterium]
MLPSVKNEDGAKTKVPSKREEKKRINIRWNSTTFFQVGLVLLLFLSYLAMESGWSLGTVKKVSYEDEFVLEENAMLSYRLEVPEVKTKTVVKQPVKERVIQQPVTEQFVSVSDNSLLSESPVASTELRPDPPATETLAPQPEKEPATSTYETVQFVPIFPGCESLVSNEARKACMSEKVSRFINRKFNADKFTDLEADKLHRVSVVFTIGRDGVVKDIKASALNSELEKEAKRVISKMPEMEPGKQGNVPVDVLFSVPIQFRVQ